MVHFTYLQSFQVDCLPKREIFDSTATECEAVDIAFPETGDIMKRLSYCSYVYWIFLFSEYLCRESMLPVCGQHSNMCNRH